MKPLQSMNNVVDKGKRLATLFPEQIQGILDSLGMCAEDAFDAQAAEHLLRGIVESSPHYTKPKK